jgi:hypothetical protein
MQQTILPCGEARNRQIIRHGESEKRRMVREEIQERNRDIWSCDIDTRSRAWQIDRGDSNRGLSKYSTHPWSGARREERSGGDGPQTVAAANAASGSACV